MKPEPKAVSLGCVYGR